MACYLINRSPRASLDEKGAEEENEKWMATVVEEIESLNHNRTWELVCLPESKNPIGCKWVYKKKPIVTEIEKEKFKARLHMRGNHKDTIATAEVEDVVNVEADVHYSRLLLLLFVSVGFHIGLDHSRAYKTK
ncbi:uncharacterized mitochondrial protein AtMg00820-like [Hibiscus syriacus]|uniref:uncharacterized mitochondrial protein AtMg00820-like n=1 Tax=Hibiscus syriacus TaxID=106335 RepID=UPI0019212C47|nr:uncharacterized mitochondrial protein AtMg00820-like [Hibiscus syriacus]